MPLITKAYTFQNGIASDAIQVNQDMDTLYNLLNGLLDAMNIANNGLNDPNKFASEVISQAKSKGLVYTQDLYSQSWVVSGGVTTASGSPANQITVTTLIANILQADGSYRHVSVGGATYVTSIINATYYLELQPDGTMNWSQTHSTQANYMPIATVTSNASGNINVITDTRATTLAINNNNLLSNTSSSARDILRVLGTVSNAMGFVLRQVRTSAGSDHTTVSMDLLKRVDATDQQYIRFGPDGSIAITPATNGKITANNNTLDDWFGNAIVAGTLTINGSGGSFANSKATSGYQKLPGGMIFMWGTKVCPIGSSTAITYPIAFPTAVVSVSAIVDSTSASTFQVYAMSNNLGLSQFSLNLVTTNASSGNMTTYWTAIGY